jgi:nucleoside-diphosphate-sugar epimerase
LLTLPDLIFKNLPADRLVRMQSVYRNSNVVVTGGASFIGSHLVDTLVELGAHVLVLDDLSSGKLEFVNKSSQVNFVETDLRYRDSAEENLTGVDIVFQLAAIHGGRGFIETFKKELLANLTIDNNVFAASAKNDVKNIVHASSACAYPIDLQNSELELNQLAEYHGSMNSSETCFADGVYGWTKLIGEYQLENLVNGTKTKGRSARIFTAYGERENESHAAIALMAKALLGADPYPIWGSGQQTRNFTYVADTVSGLLLLGSDERDIDFDVFNIGTSDHIRVIDFVKQIFAETGWEPKDFDLQLDKPVGVASRASDNSKIRNVFGWEPTVSISEGIGRTVDWYKNSANMPTSLTQLEERLMAR